MWVAVSRVNETGAFSVDVVLRDTLWRLSRVVGSKKIPGSYTVMGKNAEGESATTTLVVKAAEKKK